MKRGGIPLHKRLLSSPWVIWPLAGIASLLVRALYYSNRISHDIAPEALPYVQGEKPLVLCFWHGRLLMQAFIKPKKRRMHVLASRHRDGALIGMVMCYFGIRTVAGSSGRNGSTALRTMLQIAKRGENLAITPDGPRGPFQKAVDGAAFVAARTGYALLPVSFSASRYRRLRSWDKFLLPKPFGRVHYVFGPPIHVAKRASESELAAATAQLETTLNALTARADEYCGVPL